MTKCNNGRLKEAAKNKYDEFYTQLADIENELYNYEKHFKNKVIYCNCDDPRVSKFFHHFSYGFEYLSLKKLISTCYKNQNPDLFSRHDCEKAISLEYEGDKSGSNVPDAEEIGIKKLTGDGDFRSPESIELLQQADIVVTNPPFSLFREYVAQLMKYKKQFIIIGNKNAITYKETFQLIKENKIWLGNQPMGQDMLFDVTESFAQVLVTTKKEGSAYKIIDGVVKGRSPSVWFTNLDIAKRHEDLIIYQTYKGNEDDYPKYDNYDVINVDKTKNIPMDYAGAMGVPISFLDKYNPDQFEILGIANSARWIGYQCLTIIDGRNIYNRIIIKNKKI